MDTVLIGRSSIERAEAASRRASGVDTLPRHLPHVSARGFFDLQASTADRQGERIGLGQIDLARWTVVADRAGIARGRDERDPVIVGCAKGVVHPRCLARRDGSLLSQSNGAYEVLQGQSPGQNARARQMAGAKGCLRAQLWEKTSISAAPVFPPVDWTTSKRRKRPVNDTGTMCGSRRLPAGNGP